MGRRKDRPKPTISPDTLRRLGPRLSAIGPYVLSAGDGEAEVEWECPTGLLDLGFPWWVAFVMESDRGNFDPDERMFALWDRFRVGAVRHAAFFCRKMVAVYRESQPDLAEQDKFPPDLPDAEVLKQVGGTVQVKRLEEGGEVDYWLDVSFAASWDGQHAWDFEYDEAADVFGEPSKG